MTRFSKLAGIAALAIFCLPLGGCFESNAKSDEPQLAPVIYEITQHTPEGKLMVTDTAKKWWHNAEGRCVFYNHPDDPKNADARLLCGGLLRVKPVGR